MWPGLQGTLGRRKGFHRALSTQGFPVSALQHERHEPLDPTSNKSLSCGHRTRRPELSRGHTITRHETQVQETPDVLRGPGGLLRGPAHMDAKGTPSDVSGMRETTCLGLAPAVVTAWTLSSTRQVAAGAHRGGQTSRASCAPRGESVTSSGDKRLAPTTPQRTLYANAEPHERSLTPGRTCLRAPFL